ncbi:PP2C family protein-serine/threonine phosphatase [Cellulomonas carbonis]|uniref:Serine/threonine protein phosphatase n=1 Tax=Cellulomonas carbonis T26 TaxID=947969 RepID=A0A0A0BPC5_9CELL|nr:protein phosphatase 2C domain-containing protein [Cellulomonas carbonis]KGM10328.1 serine/threonine protein phosphatase [Cellulomonas carbonis T26]GGC00113.1 hypothetical protein GCM10010972_11080 [Cellulomonas carbonis]
MTTSLVTALRSVTGPYRASNQDSVGCSTEYAFVADGVGGHVGGDVASWTVAHRLMSALAPRDARRMSRDELRELLAQANADLALRSARDADLAGMGTTFTGIFCGDDDVRVVHIGDSRAYRLRDGRLERVTRDDSLVQLMIEAGQLDEATAQHHPQRNIIVRSLAGRRRDPEDVTILDEPAAAGDRWLLVSDGVTDYLTDDDVAAMLADATDVEDAADRLVAAAEAADSRDNVSVVVCDVVAGDVAGADGGRPYRVDGAAARDELGTVGDLSR